MSKQLIVCIARKTMENVLNINNSKTIQARLKLLVDTSGGYLEYKKLKLSFLYLKVLTDMSDEETLDWLQNTILDIPPTEKAGYILKYKIDGRLNKNDKENTNTEKLDWKYTGGKHS